MRPALHASSRLRGGYKPSTAVVPRAVPAGQGELRAAPTPLFMGIDIPLLIYFAGWYLGAPPRIETSRSDRTATHALRLAAAGNYYYTLNNKYALKAAGAAVPPGGPDAPPPPP